MAELLEKRGARRVLAAVAAAGLVGSFAVGSGVSAQTATTPAVSTSIAVVGPVPSGVTGYLVAVTCNNLQGISSAAGTANAGSQTLAALFGTTGGTQAVPFTLNAPNSSTGTLGSTCSAQLTVQGTGNLDKAGFSFSWGGAVRGQPYFTTGAGTSVRTPASGVIPVQQATVLNITVSYPQITVAKVVNGDAPVAAFAYPMVITCSNPSSAAFLVSSLANYTIPIDVNAITAADLAHIRVSVVGGGFVTGSAGARYSHGDAFANLGALRDFVAAATALPPINTVIAPVGVAGGFTGSFTLAGGANRVFSINQFPAMNTSTLCEVRETNSQGSELGYSSSNGFIAGTTTPNPPLLGVLVGGNFQSSLTKMNETITVSNTFTGDLIVSKVVTGDPKTNIAVYEISVACDKGGPKETFLLRDRQSKVYTRINAGVNCLVTETRSDGATASYSDNSGDNTTDGRVTIRRTTPVDCGQGTNITGSNSCTASVIVTNSYVPPTTTAAPTTTKAAAAPATAAAAPATAPPAPATAPPAPQTTAAPPVNAAPAPEVEAEASFTG